MWFPMDSLKVGSMGDTIRDCHVQNMFCKQYVGCFRYAIMMEKFGKDSCNQTEFLLELIIGYWGTNSLSFLPFLENHSHVNFD